MFCEFNAIGSYDTNNMICTLSDGTGNNRIFLNLTNGVGNLEAVITASGSTTVSFVGSTPSIGRHKIAIAYKSNDVVLYLDGTLLFTDTSVSIPATSKLNIGSYFNETFPFNSGINQAVLFKTRLTNSELASLTTI
jgi:ketopantoate reductase